MKTYDKLTETQRKTAFARRMEVLLNELISGALRFNDELNHDDLQARIDAAVAKAEARQTPWFAGEYVFDACREDLEALVYPEVEDALYPEPDDLVIDGVVDTTDNTTDTPQGLICEDQTIAITRSRGGYEIAVDGETVAWGDAEHILEELIASTMSDPKT
ncbi:MAG: hypothetical protein ACYC3G_00665 [Minisyncoccota bacterium]